MALRQLHTGQINESSNSVMAGFGMTRGDTRESWVVNMVNRVDDGKGNKVSPRVYTMESGDVLEVYWSGEDRNVCFNPHVPMYVGFANELQSSRRRSGRGGVV